MIAGRARAARSIAHALLAGGIALRVVTWALLRPVNRDFHIGVILRIVATGRLPFSNETDQSYHPPLYYVVAAPILALTHRPKVVQLVSLACAIATLAVFYRLIVDTPVFGRMRDRLLLFALVAVHPQLITYGLYISNDTLTILLGAAVAWQLWRWLDEPSSGRLRTLAVLCGLGLLTKATFLAIVPLLVVAVAALSWRVGPSTAVRRTLAFASIAIALGAYKFVENVVHFGRPFVTNLDGGYAWIAEQAAGRALPWAYIGFDPRRILLHPTGVVRQPYLELLYQTFWNEYLVMSNIAEAQRWPFTLAGVAALVAAIAPTVAMVVGGCAALVSLPRRLLASGPPSRVAKIQIARAIFVAMWAAILALMVAEEFRTHVWSIMHARLLLPALAGALAALRAGWDALRRAAPATGDRLARAAIAATVALLLLQHLIDLSLVPFRLAH